MPGLIANAEIFGTLVGENPLTGIVKARLLDGSSAAVLGYDETTHALLIFAGQISAVSASFSGDLYAGNVYSGHASPGAGGEYISFDDSGTLRWASGVIGAPGERQWSIYDNVNGQYVLRVHPTTGRVTVPLGLSVGLAVAGAEALRVGGSFRALDVNVLQRQNAGVQYVGVEYRDETNGVTAFCGVDYTNQVVRQNAVAAGWVFAFLTQGVARMQIDGTQTATQTALQLNLNGAMRRVTVKAGNALTAGDTVLCLA